MAKRSKRTTTKTPQRGGPGAKIVSEGGKLPARASAADYARRRAEVDAKDHEEFQGYLAEKKEADARKKAAVAPTKSRGVSRRTMFNVAVGTAVAAEAGVLGYNALGGGSVSDHGIRHAGANYTEAQRHNIVREVVDNRADIRGQSLGNWVALLPTKMGGGTYAIDLNSNRVLGSIWYWNYGDYNPISHHLCAFPSADPLHGFEFVNSTQGGQNSLIYGMNTAVTAETVPEGTNIYRVRYDGTQMELIENVSETHGARARRARHGEPEGRAVLLRDRRPEGHRRLLRPHDLQGEGLPALRLDAQRRQPARGLDQGRHAHHQAHLSRSEDRPLRLQGHQGQQDRLGNGADGRAVRRGGLAARRRPVVADRRRRHDLASRGPLGGDRRAAVRRHRHPRSREELRAGGVPAVQQGLAGPVSGAEGRQGHLEGGVRQDPFAGPRDRLLARRQVPGDDEQSPGKQLLDLQLRRSRSDATGARSPMSRIRCGAASIPTRSTWCSRSTAPSST